MYFIIEEPSLVSRLVGYVSRHTPINYSPSCRSKPVRPSFIFGTQIKLFFMNNPGDISGSTVNLQGYENIFLCNMDYVDYFNDLLRYVSVPWLFV